MDFQNFIRAIIFLIAGLVVLFFPERLYKFQKPIMKKLKIKHPHKREIKHYKYLAIFFIIVAIILFIISIFN